MNISRRSFRHSRFRIYRNVCYIQSCFTFTNIICAVLILTICYFVLMLQKLEDPFSVNFFTNTKRREIIVTTAKIPLRKKSTTECDKVINQISSFEKSWDSSIGKTRPLDKKTKSQSFRYLPAIRNFKISKSLQQFLNSSNKIATHVFPSVATGDVILNKSKQQVSSNTIEEAKLLGIEYDNEIGEATKDVWLNVNSHKNKVLAFSAYWDDRLAIPYVRVMVIMLTKKSPTVYCRLHIPADNTCYDVTATKKILNEHWRLKYASHLLTCPTHKSSVIPTHVSLSTSETFDESATLPIHRNKNDTVSSRGSIAVCVKPLHYEYNRATWLLEFLELHRILGVEHFFFYNHTVGPHVEMVLQTYINKGLVTTFQWNIGIKSQKEIRTEAIFSSLNDCLYRTMFLFKYVIMLDFDEYIIPRDHNTYTEMLEKLEKDGSKIRGTPGSFIFKNAFFYLYWENDTTAYGVLPEKPPDYIPYFLTQYKTRRLTSTMKYGSRSKYIVKPDKAIEVGNHVVWKHIPKNKPMNVPDTIGILHHYRICEFGGFSCLKKKSAIDQVALRFGPELLDRVRRQCEIAFKSDGGKCPISPPLGSPW